MFAYPLGQSKAVSRARHINDGEHDVDPDLLMQQYLHCLISTCRLDDLVPAIAQVLRERRPHQNVVLDDKDGF